MKILPGQGDVISVLLPICRSETQRAFFCQGRGYCAFYQPQIVGYLALGWLRNDQCLQQSRRPSLRWLVRPGLAGWFGGAQHLHQQPDQLRQQRWAYDGPSKQLLQ